MTKSDASTAAYLLSRERALLTELSEVHDALRRALDEGHFVIRPAVQFGMLADLPRWRAALDRVNL